LLHRDIKPENILIDKRGQPVLIDFGSARESVGKTMTMTSIVTHGYSPIEQYQTKGRMGPWTDIYSIAAVMCRAITGEKPPVATDRLVSDDFVWLSQMNVSEFTLGFRAAIDRGLAIRTEDRPASLREWHSVIESRAEPQANGGQKISAQQSKPSAHPNGPPPPVWYTGNIDAPEETTGLQEKEIKTGNKAILVAALAALVVIALVLDALDQKKEPNAPSAPNSEAVDTAVPPKQQSADELYKEAEELMSVDPGSGRELLMRAAEAGSAEAQNRLGEIYEVQDANPSAAAEWYRKASNQGNPNAKARLASLTATGEGVPQDTERAVVMVREALEEGASNNRDAFNKVYEAELAAIGQLLLSVNDAEENRYEVTANPTTGEVNDSGQAKDEAAALANIGQAVKRLSQIPDLPQLLAKKSELQTSIDDWSAVRERLSELRDVFEDGGPEMEVDMEMLITRARSLFVKAEWWIADWTGPPIDENKARNYYIERKKSASAALQDLKLAREELSKMPQTQKVVEVLEYSRGLEKVIKEMTEEPQSRPWVRRLRKSPRNLALTAELKQRPPSCCPGASFSDRQPS
jgi:hypothetical protein